MNQKIKWIITIGLLVTVIGIIVGLLVFNGNNPNIDYKDYYIQYDGTWDRDIEDYVFYIVEDEEQWIYHESTRNIEKVTADYPFVLYLKTTDVSQIYKPISNHKIYDLYKDQFGNYFIKVTSITNYDLNPTYIIGGEYDNQS